MSTQKRCYCGNLGLPDEGKKVEICGWIHSRRDHGGVIFIDLRDIRGIVQVVFNPGTEVFQYGQDVKMESVVRVSGVVRRRPQGTENPRIPTGEIEVVAEKMDVLNEAAPLPFSVSDYLEVSEEIRLKYRYLDLRRPSVKDIFVFRSRLASLVRNFLEREGFIEVETPLLTKSTPEGARDFLVPSRLDPGKFYALPQSPQLYKQILMVAGFDKYYQLARCFRDEDLRADRQPEFTQLDLEMSFVEEKDIEEVIERLLAEIFEKLLDKKITLPFPRISYSEAMLKYGSDKPDLRFGMEIADLNEEFKTSGFKVFRQALDEKKGVIRAMAVPGGAEKFSRSEIDGLIARAVELGAAGLAWMKKTAQGYESSIVKFFTKDELGAIDKKLSPSVGDLVIFVADKPSVASGVMGALRLYLAEYLKIPREGYKFCWIEGFPLFEWDPEEKKWNAMHHPFTSPEDEKEFVAGNIPTENLRARAYDIVLNGTELGGGSIRIHHPLVQKKMFEVLGISDEDARTKFGFLIEALTLGAPPHGGIALGFDRLTAMLLGESSIREVIAFPKTQKGSCPLTGAPDFVSAKQMKEVFIKSVLPQQTDNLSSDKSDTGRKK